MAYKSDGSGGREIVGGRGGGLGGAGGGRSTAGRDRPSNAGGARSKDEMDAKTKKALEEAFGAAGQASRQQDTPTNERQYKDVNRDATPNDLPPALNPLAYEENPTNTVAATPLNALEMVKRAVGLGPGMVATAAGDIARQAGYDPLEGTGLGGGFEGPQGQTTTGERRDHAPGKEDGELVNDQFGQPTQPAAPPKPPAGPVGLPDIWDYPDEADLAASAPQDGLSDEERRRRGNTSIVVLGQGGLAI